jgi:hypothetical protein
MGVQADVAVLCKAWPSLLRQLEMIALQVPSINSAVTPGHLRAAVAINLLVLPLLRPLLLQISKVTSTRPSRALVRPRSPAALPPRGRVIAVAVAM